MPVSSIRLAKYLLPTGIYKPTCIQRYATLYLLPNIGMVLTRQSKEPFAALCASCICTHKIVAVYDRSFMFPLYLYPNPDELALQTERRPKLQSRNS